MIKGIKLDWCFFVLGLFLGNWFVMFLVIYLVFLYVFICVGFFLWFCNCFLCVLLSFFCLCLLIMLLFVKWVCLCVILVLFLIWLYVLRVWCLDWDCFKFCWDLLVFDLFVIKGGGRKEGGGRDVFYDFYLGWNWVLFLWLVYLWFWNYDVFVFGCWLYFVLGF